MPSSPGPIRQLWLKWASLKLPWRRKWLCGSDLHGNTFWEFKDALNSNRFRRIVRYNRKTHYGDVQMSPQWIQWLRQTRADAPSILEQQQDVMRQAQMKQLAAAADERWASVPSYMDSPKLQQPQPAMEPRDQGGYGNKIETKVVEEKGAEAKGVRNIAASQEDLADEAERQTTSEQSKKPERQSTSRKRERMREVENQWTKGGGGDSWQPQSWSPGVAPRR
ncbi:MAG: hypothetical protein M1821_007343 [Bathelium mastoideum]|nr:MAG: hypothetical protein M1821_007343 [Bathelium mastoideum]